MTALLCASEEGNIAGLEELTTVANFDLNICNELGETACHIASGAGQLEVLRFLHFKGAKLNVIDKHGDNAIFWAARNGHAVVVEYLIKHAGLNVNQRNKCKESAVHVAVRYGHYDVLELLCVSGADVSLQDEHLETPLHIACWHGFSALAQLLCAMRPLLDLRNKDEETALHCAAARGHMECVQTLITSKADLDVQDKLGQTALILAIRRRHVNIAILLLHSGCKLDVVDHDGDSALHHACKEGLLTVVQALCALGCAVDIPNKASQYPLHVAAKEGHIDIVRCLCLANCNVNVKNKDGLTADITALAQSHSEVGELIGKLKNDLLRESFIQQLIPETQPLKRIKLKVFGHSGVGKTKLLESLRAGLIGGFFRRRESSTSSREEPMNQETGVKMSVRRNRIEVPMNTVYTRGIDVQQLNVPGAGDFSSWEFSGFQPYHQLYDHFVGNTDCIHLVLFRVTDPPEVQYAQALYWMNFLQGRIMPSEPIGQGGVSSKPAHVALVGTHADLILNQLNKTNDGDLVSSELDAMLKTLRHRFGMDFDILDRPLILDAMQPNSQGMKSLKAYLSQIKANTIQNLPKATGFLDETVNFLNQIRKSSPVFPVVPWPGFIDLVRKNVNPLAGEVHCRQLIQQLQLMGEVVYLKGDVQDYDYVVYNPAWLCHDIIGSLLSVDNLQKSHSSGLYTSEDFQHLFPEISEASDLLQILDALCLCTQFESDGDLEWEFPAFVDIFAPATIWEPEFPGFVYGGMRLKPPHGMDHMLGVMWPRIQVQLRRSMQEFQDPIDAELSQWANCSKLCSGNMEGLISLYRVDQAIEVKVRGPADLAVSCFYFMEDLANIVEQVVTEIAPGLPLERHFLSPRDLSAHSDNPIAYPPESIMEMQLEEKLKIRPPLGCTTASSSPANRNSRTPSSASSHASLSATGQLNGHHNNNKGETLLNSSDTEPSEESWETFLDVACFGAKEIILALTFGVDLPVSQIPLSGRRDLAQLLDPPDSMGRDWCLLMVKLNLTEQLPEVDSSGPQLSKTDSVLAEWSLNTPHATIGMLCKFLKELGRQDAVEALYRSVPLYMFAPVEETTVMTTTSQPGVTHDSGLVSSTGNSATSQRSSSTLSR